MKINAVYRTDDDNIEIAIKLASVDNEMNVITFTKKNVKKISCFSS